jgi:hypothetical protein
VGFLQQSHTALGWKRTQAVDSLPLCIDSPTDSEAPLPSSPLLHLASAAAARTHGFEGLRCRDAADRGRARDSAHGDSQ